MSSANSIFKMVNKECKDKAPGPEADPVLSSLLSKKPGRHLSRSTPAAPPCITSPSELAPDQSNELCVSEPGPSPRSKEAQSAGKTRRAKTFTGKINRNKGKELVKHSRAKGRGSPTSASASKKPADATNNDDIRIIKNQMQVLMGLVPVISEMKSAYDSYLEDSLEESECEGNSGIVNDDVAGPSGDGENIPDAVTQDSMLYFDKVAGTSAPSEMNVKETSLKECPRFSQKACPKRH
ncbi:hypothetical protein PoB_003408000 [Plakobranchus ocellatus]|uniref:Uncharacterized protein n=1 Tax=Plakobranchus ocellatus TaxID=259542 RepID=A0AAV4AL35_9GAST|nr:hypothetical protein PoB_003408000 [Plakobranchus ocellatus]